MLRVPNSLLAAFADYAPLGIDADAVLDHLLGNPDRILPNLDLIEIRRRGLDDAWTSRYLEDVAMQLAHGCLRHRRFFNGISDQGSGTSTPTQTESRVRPMTQRMSRFLRTPLETLPRGPIESATNWIAHRGLRNGDLILIEAPVCVPRTGGTEPSIFLCDYPEYLRRARDPVVPLRLSSPLRKKLIDQIGPASAWNPLLRTLGTVQPTAGHDEIEVLALFRSRPESPVANWKTELFGEAKAYLSQPQEQQAVYPSDLWKDLNRAQTAATVEEKKSEIDWIMKQYADPGGYKWKSIASDVRTQDNLQDGVYGFWPVLIAILRMWPNRFPLYPQEMNALLEDFDQTFSEKWKENQEQLEPLGFFRFTEQAAAAMRQNVESLERQASPFVPAQTAASPQLHL